MQALHCHGPDQREHCQPQPAHREGPSRPWNLGEEASRVSQPQDITCQPTGQRKPATQAPCHQGGCTNPSWGRVASHHGKLAPCLPHPTPDASLRTCETMR